MRVDKTRERQCRIVEFVRQHIVEYGHAPTIDAIAASQRLTAKTVRRDLAELRLFGTVTFDDRKIAATLWVEGLERPPVKPLNAPGGPKWKGWAEAKFTPRRHGR